MLEEIARLQRENHNLQLVIKNNRDETGETEMKVRVSRTFISIVAVRTGLFLSSTLTHSHGIPVVMYK